MRSFGVKHLHSHNHTHWCVRRDRWFPGEPGRPYLPRARYVCLGGAPVLALLLRSLRAWGDFERGCLRLVPRFPPQKKAASGYSEPGHRLPPMALGTIVIPSGLTIFGLTAQRRIHYIVPIGSTNLIGFGFVAVFLASSSYLVDAFGIYAASATAVTTVLRNAAGLSSTVGKARPRLGCHSVRIGGPGCSICALVLTRYGQRMRKMNKRFQVPS